jgi:hypothetical protein
MIEKITVSLPVYIHVMMEHRKSAGKIVKMLLNPIMTNTEIRKTTIMPAPGLTAPTTLVPSSNTTSNKPKCGKA